MPYNKRQILSDNLSAIRTMLKYKGSDSHPTEEDIQVLSRFNGYGGVDAIAKDPDNDSLWNGSDNSLRELVRETFNVIDSSSLPFNLKNIYSDGIRQSILTQFFTPQEICDAITSSLKSLSLSGIRFNRILDPSAGMSALTKDFTESDITSLDKDPIVASIQSVIHSHSGRIRYSRKGFEEYSIDDKNFGSYDLVISNIPFGDIRVTDRSFQESGNRILSDSQKYIHNYFFAKGLSSIREGGILCFITSTGFLDSRSNQELREYINRNADVISTIRFPKGMFSDNAGTETQSDLVILQKNTGKGKMDIDFINSMTLTRNDIQFSVSSRILLDKENTISSSIEIGKNMYGRYDYIVNFNGTNNDIADILKSKLGKDFLKINRELFLSNDIAMKSEEDLSVSDDAHIYLPQHILNVVPDLSEDTDLNNAIAFARYITPKETYKAYLLEYSQAEDKALILASSDNNGWDLQYVSISDWNNTGDIKTKMQRDMFFKPEKLSEIKELKEYIQARILQNQETDKYIPQHIVDIVPGIGDTADQQLVQKMAYARFVQSDDNILYLLEYNPTENKALVFKTTDQPSDDGQILFGKNWEEKIITIDREYLSMTRDNTFVPEYLFLINELDEYISRFIPKIPEKVYSRYNDIQKNYDGILILKANAKEAFVIGERNCDIIDRYTTYSSQIYSLQGDMSSRVNLLPIRLSEVDTLCQILSFNDIGYSLKDMNNLSVARKKYYNERINERLEGDTDKRTGNKAFNKNKLVDATIDFLEDKDTTETKETEKGIISLQDVPDIISYPKEKILPTDIEGMYTVLKYKNIECIGIIKDIDRDNPSFIVDREITSNPKKNTVLKDYIALRDTYDALYHYEYVNKKPADNMREELNRQFDRFVKKHGNFRKRNIKGIIRQDIKSYIAEAFEKEDGNGNFVKSDIFFQPTIVNNRIVEVKTSEDALMQSINEKGIVDFGYMSSLLHDMDVEQMKEDLRGVVFYNPIMDEYCTRDKLLNGNIYHLIDNVKSMMTDHENDHEIRDTLKLLENNIPEKISFNNIGITLGERWIPEQIYNDFIVKIFELPENSDVVTVTYDRTTEEFDVVADTIRASRYNKIGIEYSYVHEYKDPEGRVKSYRKYLGHEILKFGLQDKIEEIKKEVYDRNSIDPRTNNYKIEKVQDVQAMRALRERVDKIKSEFRMYMLNLPEEQKAELEDIYNRTYNAFPKTDYDGRFQKFNDINFRNLGYDDLYDSQKNAIWRIKVKGGGIIDHEVGGGKTMIMCTAAHELKRLGIARKPLIIALKANVQDIANTYRKAYPMDRVLYTDAKALTQENRVRTLSMLMNNNWDCVIMTHEQFEHIAPNPEIERDILSKELEDNYRNIEINTQNNISVKSLVKSQEKLKDKLKIVQERIEKRSDNNVDFGMLGIDHIFVDESHKYKNLMYQTRHANVAGLGNTNGSQRATVMLSAIRTIQKNTGNDYGVTFLSGTTITNSLTELYALFKYMIPGELERMRIKNFDSWAAVFATKSADYELSVTNQLQEKERFREFNKVPELAAMYTQVADYKSIDHIGINRPEKNVILVDIEPSDDQKLLNKRIIEFVSSGDASFLGENIQYTDKQTTAKMLLATNMSRKASLDMRMIDPTYEDSTENKLSVCARNIAGYYRKYDEQKGTQFVFSDIGTPKVKKSNTEENIEDEELKDDEKDLFITSFNPYVELKRKLVEDHNIPADEIRFIHEFNSDIQRDKFCEEFNKGNIRIVIGSTTKLGTGINAQQRAVAIHHLDVPWTPASIEQRNGRAVRKGNEVAKLYAGNKVDILVYGVRNTLDAFCWNAIERKDLFIKQIKDNNIKNRSIDESKMDTKGEGLSPKEICALLSGNEEYKTLIVKEKEFEKLIAEKDSFYKQRETKLRSIRMLVNNPLEINKKTPRQIVDYNTMRMKQAQRDNGIFLSRVERDKDGEIINRLSLIGLNDSSDENIKLKLTDIYQQYRTKGEYVEIGSIYGFPVCVRTKEYEDFLNDSFYGGKKETVNEFFVKGTQENEKNPIYYKVNNRGIAVNAKVVANYFLKTITEEIPKVMDSHTKAYEKAKEYVQEYEKLENEHWSKDNILSSIQEEIADLQRKLNNNNRKTGVENKQMFKEYCYNIDRIRIDKYRQKISNKNEKDNQNMDQQVKQVNKSVSRKQMKL